MPRNCWKWKSGDSQNKKKMREQNVIMNTPGNGREYISLPSVTRDKHIWLLFYVKKIFAYRIMINIARKLFTVLQIFKLLYVLILWTTFQRNISTVCRFTGLKTYMCSGVCIPTVCLSLCFHSGGRPW